MTTSTEPAFVVDLDARELVVNGHPVEVTETELALAAYLAAAPPRRFIPHDELLTEVWGYPPEGDSRVVRETVRRVRRRLAAVGFEHAIENRRGYGYRLADGMERGV